MGKEKKRNGMGKDRKNKSFSLRRSFFTIFLLLVLIVVAGYGYFFTSSNIFANSVKKLENSLSTRIIYMVQGKPYYLRGSSDPLMLFDIAHSPHFDKRIAEGLSEAFREYVRLFTLKYGLETDVEMSAEQLDMDQYKLTYKVSVGSRKRTYEFGISTKIEDVEKNLEGAARILSKFSDDFSGQVHSLNSVKRVYDGGDGMTGEIFEDIYSLDYLKIFGALKKVEKEISPQGAAPELLYLASEAFSWLMVSKNVYEFTDLVDYLGRHAVSNYLVARVLDGRGAPEPGRSLGLLLMGLDYPGAAVKVLDGVKNNRQVVEVLSAFARRDVDVLKSIGADRKRGGRLVDFLTARAHEEAGEFTSAEKLYEKLLYNYPDFVLAKEYASYQGNVGMARRYVDEYIMDLIETHLRLINELAVTDWIEKDSVLQIEISKDVSGGKVLAKWLTLHKAFIDRIEKTKGGGAVLDAEFLKEFFKKDLMVGLQVYNEVWAEKLGSLSHAADVVDLVERVYPDSDLARGLRLWLMVEYGKKTPVIKYMKGIDKKTAGPYLLKVMLRAYRGWKFLRERTDTIEVLDRYRNSLNPNAKGYYMLHYIYNGYGYRPLAREYMKKAISTDPYDYNKHRAVGEFDETGEFIVSGEKLLEKSYGFFVAAARWHRDHENFEEAEGYYKKAIARSPGELPAVKDLGQLYSDRKDYRKAIKIWKGYLKYDDTTLSAVVIKNRIGKAYMDMGWNEKAYDLLLKNKESYQYGALVNFALASEKTGRMLQAEEYFRKAAERYQSNDAPVEFALFYLRQNDKESAVRILREYERYNHYTYYFSALIDYGIEKNELTLVKDVVYKVKDGTPDIWVLWNLARKYEKKDKYGMAAELYKSLLDHNVQPYNFANWYYGAFKKGGRGDLDEAIDWTVSKISGDKRNVMYFGVRLLSDGHYDAAYKVFRDFDKANDYRKDVIFLFMTMAWKASGADPAGEREIREKADSYTLGGIHRDLVGYLLGDIEEKDLMIKINDPDKACEAHYTLGLVKAANGNMDEAIKHLVISLETKASTNIEYEYANELLEKIRKADR